MKLLEEFGAGCSILAVVLLEAIAVSWFYGKRHWPWGEGGSSALQSKPPTSPKGTSLEVLEAEPGGGEGPQWLHPPMCLFLLGNWSPAVIPDLYAAFEAGNLTLHTSHPVGGSQGLPLRGLMGQGSIHSPARDSIPPPQEQGKAQARLAFPVFLLLRHPAVLQRREGHAGVYPGNLLAGVLGGHQPRLPGGE